MDGDCGLAFWANPNGRLDADLTVDAVDASEWDMYNCSGTYGLFSKRAIDVMTPFTHRCFEVVPISMNRVPYFTLRFKQFLDCLDRDQSEIKLFANSSDIKSIDRYSFRAAVIPDPILFTIPEQSFVLFGTEGVVEAVKTAGLRGVMAIDSDSLPAYWKGQLKVDSFLI